MYILKYRFKSPKFYSYTLNVAYTTLVKYPFFKTLHVIYNVFGFLKSTFYVNSKSNKYI